MTIKDILYCTTLTFLVFFCFILYDAVECSKHREEMKNEWIDHIYDLVIKIALSKSPVVKS